MNLLFGLVALPFSGHEGRNWITRVDLYLLVRKVIQS